MPRISKRKLKEMGVKEPPENEVKVTLQSEEHLSPEAGMARDFHDMGLTDKYAYCHQHYFFPGRQWRFDFAWPDLKIAMEYEGGTWQVSRHNTGTGYRGDVDKYNSAALMGWMVLRITRDMYDDAQHRTLLLGAIRNRLVDVVEVLEQKPIEPEYKKSFDELYREQQQREEREREQQQ